MLFTTLLLFSFTLPAQKWIKVNQSYYGMKYKLPPDWAVDGFGFDNNWEGYGSSVCDCAGSINISGNDSLHMVIYPSKKSGVDSLKRNRIWDYTFVVAKKIDDINGKNLIFETSTGYLTCEGCSEESTKDKYTIRYFGKFKSNYYFIYFYGSETYINKNQALIHSILGTFTGIQ